MDFIGGDAWMNAMYGDIFRLLMVQFELAGARMASCNSSCIHALRCVTVVEGPVAHRLEHCDGVVAMMCGGG